MWHPIKRTKQEFSQWQTYLGFLLPIVLAVLIGLAIDAHSKPITLPQTSSTSSSSSTSGTSSGGTLPTSDEVAAANAAILAYCTNDLRAGTNCSLVANSDVTAPGFVQASIAETGSISAGVSSTQGIALTKGSGSSWTVLWVGQGCIPADVASTNNVPSTFNVCGS